MKWFLDKIFERSICYAGGGGGGGADPNATTISQTALWGQYAKDWNTYIRDIEPRTEYAFKQQLLPDNRISAEMRTGVLDKLDLRKTLGNGVPVQTNILRKTPETGDALGKAYVLGGEAQKDYKAATLSNILTSKLGAKTNAQSALGTMAKGETENFLKNYDNKTAIDAVESQAGSAGIGAMAVGTYGGLTGKPSTPLTKQYVVKA